MFEDVADAALVSAIGDSARAENKACARRLAAIAELYRRRQIPGEGGQNRERWRIDPWEAVAAEVAAAEGITTAAAAAQLHNAICLHERLPKVAALFATGAISYRIVHLIVNRTLLALEPDILAAIDAELADALTRWGPLSLNKTEHAIDALVERQDPDARRRVESVVRSRYVDIEHRDGIAALYGEVQSTDATLLDRRLTALAHTVCTNDPRTMDQRRADAVGALAAGHTALICACGQPDCTAPESPTTTSVVVHVVARGNRSRRCHGRGPARRAARRWWARNRARPRTFRRANPRGHRRPPDRAIPHSAPASCAQSGSCAGRAPDTRRNIGRPGRPRRRGGAAAHSPGGKSTRTALPSLCSAGGFRALPRPHLPVRRLRPTRPVLRRRPYRPVRRRRPHARLQLEVPLSKTPFAQDLLDSMARQTAPRRHRCVDLTHRAELHHPTRQPAAVSDAVSAHRRITHRPNGTTGF